MTDDRRHHVATRREIIFVEVPVAGTMTRDHRAKPPAYRHDQHQPWRPATRHPSDQTADQGRTGRVAGSTNADGKKKRCARC